MVMALEGTPPELEKELREKPDRFAKLLQTPRKGKPVPVPASEYGDLRQIIADIIADAGGERCQPRRFSMKCRRFRPMARV